MLARNEKWLYWPVTLMVPGLTYLESSSMPTCPPPTCEPSAGPAGPLAPVAPGVVVSPLAPVAPAGRLGYVAVMQQPLESAFGPLWGAWSKVIAISPPLL